MIRIKNCKTCVDTDDKKQNELLYCADVKIDKNYHQLC